MVDSLWRGDWIQQNNENDDIDYVQYEKSESTYFWDHLNPQRLGVPRYQTFFRQITWLFFLFGESSRLIQLTGSLLPIRSEVS